MSHREKSLFIEKQHPLISIVRQAELLNISRSSIYYAPRPNFEDIRIMNALDGLYMKYPFYGSRRMRWALKDEYDISICREHIQRLMRTIGIEAIYPKRSTSFPVPGHYIYPYLLRNLPIVRSNQVWGADITYVRMKQDFCYLAAIMDWRSRYVLAWEISPTMETEFCATALRSALGQSTPEIHNSDQGSQFTSQEYTSILNRHGVSISMDGRGRCMDNIFTERLWRAVKYEEIYLKSYCSIDEARENLDDYFTFYNDRRRHQSLEYKTPQEVYFTAASKG